MKRIDEIDKNFRLNETITEADIVFYDVKEEPFDVYGLYDYKNEPVYTRLPADVAKATSAGVAELAFCTAGGRVRFKTDSEYVAIMARAKHTNVMPHMTVLGQGSFDLYVTENGSPKYSYSLKRGPYEDTCSDIKHFGSREMRDIIINFPLYNGVEELCIGLQADAKVSGGDKYKHEKPVLYYGSSITQGGCASRPGNSYQGFISRKYDCDFINLGFSGCACGEDAIVDYMRSLDISVFVCDYDYNAPTVEHLEKTHERLYKRFREMQKDTPIIFVSKPDFSTEDDRRRREIILNTYNNAIASGDKNVYFVDGEKLFEGEYSDGCTVDGCHPNDIGFMRMADKIGKIVGELLNS